MPESRPIPLLVAVVAVGLLGLAGLMAAPFVFAQAASAEALDDHLGAIGGAFLAVAGLAVAIVGLLGAVGAIGLWRGSPWGWIAGALATALAIVGAFAAMAAAETGTALVFAAVLGLTGSLAVWWPGTRRACGL